MKRIKAFALLLGVVVLASCASQKRVIYLQDTQADEQVKIAQDYQIRIKPLDRLTVVVNSRDPELAAPFNTSTSLNSLTGTPLSTYSSNATSLQIRTVDEDGNLDMPIIGPIQCKGKTRSELAQEITAIEGDLKDDTQTNLHTYRKEIAETINNDIVLRHSYQAGVIEHNLGDDTEVLRATEVLENPTEYQEITTMQTSEKK